jgi:hypothetical protein
VTPVRPYQIAPTPAPAATAQSDAAKLAAARAFFAAAVGKPAPAQATQMAPPQAARTPVQVPRIPDPAAPAPEKILRPGSLLDIRI